MSLTIPDLTVIANRQTFERARAEAMGFTFLHIRVEQGIGTMERDTLQVVGSFRCVCGREEHFRNVMSMVLLTHPDLEWVERELDPAAFLRRAGSFSREHLISDGYRPAEVEAIIRRGEKFDQQALDALRAIPIEVARDLWAPVAFKQPAPPRELASSETHARQGIKERL